MLVRARYYRLRRALGQPDGVVGILCMVLLLVAQFNGLRLPLPLTLLLSGLLVFQALVTHVREYLSLSQEWGRLGCRGTVSWGFALILWSVTITLTGGLRSPLFPWILLETVYNSCNRRRERYAAGVILFALTLLLPYVIVLVSPAWVPKGDLPRVQLWAFMAFCLGTVLFHYLWFADYHMGGQEFISSMGIFWAGYNDESRFFKAVLARAMCLYRAKWGFVSVPVKDLSKGEEQPDPETGDLEIACRIGEGVDDPPFSPEEKRKCEDCRLAGEPAKHSVYEAREKGVAVRRSRQGWSNQGGIPGPVRTEFSFALRRFETNELIAVFTIMTDKYLTPMLPEQTPLLDAIITEGQAVYEMLIYSHGYRELLPAPDRSEFKEKLRETCNKLVSPEGRPVEVELVVGQERLTKEGRIVPTWHRLDEGRKHSRSIAVTAQLSPKANTTDVYTVDSFLGTVANASVIRQMLWKDEALSAAKKGPIGLCDLEPPDDGFSESIIALPGPNWDAKGLVGCGFRLLRVNDLMRWWNPRIPKDLSYGKNCEQLFCYRHFTGLDQDHVCPGCPCVRLYRKFLLASPEERDRIAELLEVGVSHSPAGKMQIYRHFELAASLVLNEFAMRSLRPKLEKETDTPESIREKVSLIRDEVSFIRETVIDRTLETEVLFIMTSASAEIDIFVGRVIDARDAAQSAMEEIANALFQTCIEGLGRAFQANEVFVVELGAGQEDTKIRHWYLCACGDLPTDKNPRDKETRLKKLVSQERDVLDYVQSSGQGTEKYFELRPSLFERQTMGDRAEIAKEETSALKEHVKDRKGGPGALEFFRNKAQGTVLELFQIASSSARRIIAVDVPFTRFVILLCTGEPEDWERLRPGGDMLPRELELNLCAGVGDMLGFLLKAMHLADQYANAMIGTRVSELAHEMSFVFVSLPAHAETVHRLINAVLDELDSLARLGAKPGVKHLLQQWNELVTARQRDPTPMSPQERSSLARAYKAALYRECDPPIYGDVWFRVAKSGVHPSQVEALSSLTGLPADEKLLALEIMEDLVFTDVALQHIEDTDVFTRAVFSGILGKSAKTEVHLASCVSQVIRLLGPTHCVRMNVVEGLTVRLDLGVLFVILKNYIGNAIEATESSDCQDKCIEVNIELVEGNLIIDVVSPPPLIPAEFRDQIFSRGFSTKRGVKRGIGLSIVKRAVMDADGRVDCLEKDGRNVFQAVFPNVEVVS